MRFNHLTLLVSDLERSLRFYEALGLVAIVYEAPRYARLVFPEGDETLSLEVPDTGRPLAARGAPSFELYFECTDLDDRVSELVRAGVTFAQLPTDMPYLWREARLLDPDGHELRLYHAGKNRLDPPWRLHSARPLPGGHRSGGD